MLRLKIFDRNRAVPASLLRRDMTID